MVVQLVVVFEPVYRCQVPFPLLANFCWSVLLCLYVTVGGGHRLDGWVGGWVDG